MIVADNYIIIDNQLVLVAEEEAFIYCNNWQYTNIDYNQFKTVNTHVINFESSL